MTAPISITLEQQITAVIREIAMRESAYPKWIEQKRMLQSRADHEIAAMKAVLATLQGLKESATAGASSG